MPHSREATSGIFADVAPDFTALASEHMDLLFPAAVDNDETEPWLHEALTAREAVVLAEGASNKEIASELNISEHTAKFHVSSILAKLACRGCFPRCSPGADRHLTIARLSPLF